MHLRDIFTAAATLIAIYAAILSTLNFLRDRRKVKISFSRETEYFEQDGIGGAGETVTVVNIANSGRRPVTITSVRAIRLFPRGGFVELDCNPKLQIELKEGQRVVAWAYDEQVDLPEIDRFEANDATGNPYRKNVAPLFRRLWSRLRIKLVGLRRAYRTRRLLKP